MTSTPVTEVRPTWGLGVRTLRGIQGLTQSGLAELANTTQARISELENGRRNIADDLRVRIARALDVDPYELFPYPDVEAPR
jgi:transcriptional regulator with XRE-family HTH domain